MFYHLQRLLLIFTTAGSLLIWLTLGPSRPSSYRESLNVAKLSIVVTAYQKDDSKAKLTSSFRACNEGRRWVRKEYFCDGRTNCALDRDPADESVESCPGQAGDQTTSGPTGDGDIHPPLNLISITLVLGTTQLFIKKSSKVFCS